MSVSRSTCRRCRCIFIHSQRPRNSRQHRIFCSVPSRLCAAPMLLQIQHQIHSAHSGRKQDLTPTNQNIRSSTCQHPISCILVPRHDRAHGNYSCRLKSPNHQIFNALDPFYPRHFAFLFSLPAVPYCRGGTQCLKMDFSHNTSTKYLKQGAHIRTCNHNNAPEGSVQTLTVLSPTLLPLNPFQSFV